MTRQFTATVDDKNVNATATTLTDLPDAANDDSDNATVTAAADAADQTTFNIDDMTTDELPLNTFTVSDDQLPFEADDMTAYTTKTVAADIDEFADVSDDAAASLNGTISGDFTGGAFKINDSDFLTISAATDISISADNTGFKIFDFDDGASLQVAAAGTYIVNDSTINAGGGDIIANHHQNIQIEGNVISMEIENTVKAANIMGTEAADTISNIRASDVTVYALGGNDEIINIDSGGVLINTGEGDNNVTNLLNYSTVTGASEFEGTSIIGGSGNDNLYNIGGNYASIISGAGDDYISNRHGYYPTISAGEGSDFIRISNGHYQNIDGGSGDDTITADAEAFSSSDWAMGGFATLLGGDGNDLITPVYTNDASIDGGNGDDTIVTNGKNSTITGGTGSNLISLTSAESGEPESLVIVADEGGITTVYGFKESDTLVFTDGELNKAVELNSNGLSFWTDTVMGGSEYLKITFPDITKTRLTLQKYGTDEILTEAVIAAGDIYNVTDGAADIYVGAVATPNQGISFEGITDDVDVALEDTRNDITYLNLHSVIGGDGNTTITGSPTDDTIIAGTGATTIIGSAGNDVLIGNEETTFIIDGEKLELADSAITLKTSDDGYVVYDEGRAAADSAKAALLEYNPEARVYSAEDIASLLADNPGEDFWDGDMYAEYPTVEADNYIDGSDDKNTGKKVSYINKAVNVDQRFNDEGGNAAIVGNEAAGIITLTAGSGGDSLMNYSTAATVSMIGGSGNDYIVAAGGTNEIIDISAGGADTILAAAGAYIKGYHVPPNTVFMTDAATAENIVDNIMNGTLYLNATYFGPSADKRTNLIDFDYSNGTFAKFQTTNGHQQLFGWSPQSGGTVIATNFSESAIIFGIAPTGDSTLQGGTANDTIYAANGDTVLLSAGNDLIKIDHTHKTAGNTIIDPAGVDIDIDTTIEGYDAATDMVNVSSGSGYVFTFKPSTVRIKHTAGTGGLNTLSGFNFGADEDAETYTVDTLDTLDFAGHDNLQVNNTLIKNANNQVIKANYAGEDWVVEFGDDLIYDDAVNCYGNTSATKLKISDVDSDDVEVWLNGQDGKIYNNVKDVYARSYSGNTKIAGNDMSNVLTASTGDSSLWGGSGSESDTLIGSDGYDEFFYLMGNGRDEIRHITADDLTNLLNISIDDITKVSTDLLSTTLEFNNGEKLLLYSFDELRFKFSDGSTYRADKKTKSLIQN